MTVTCLLRIIYPDSVVIGANAAISVIFSVGVFAFWVHSILFTSNFVRLAIGQARIKDAKTRERINELERRSRNIFPLLFALDAIACVMPIAMTGATDRTTVYIMALIHYMFLAFLICILGLWLLPTLIGPLVIDIEAAISLRDRGTDTGAVLLQITKKMKLFLADLRIQSLANCVFAGFFGGWPMLQSFTSYWLPIAWTSAAFITITSLHAERPIVRNATSKNVLASSSNSPDRTLDSDSVRANSQRLNVSTVVL